MKFELDSSVKRELIEGFKNELVRAIRDEADFRNTFSMNWSAVALV